MNLARQSSVFPALWQAIPVMIRLQRGCWGDVAETEQSSSVAGVPVISYSFCRLCHASHISFSFWFLSFSLPELVDEAKGLVVRGSAVLCTA